MKIIKILLISIFIPSFCYSQNTKKTIDTKMVKIDSKIVFFEYNRPYADTKHTNKAAIKLILTIKNNGEKAIPDLCVSNRSKHVNLYIDDSLNNPLSLYNGAEIIGEHLLYQGDSDTYEWWFFEEDAFADIFTFHWQYLDLFSKKIRVNISTHTSQIIE